MLALSIILSIPHVFVLGVPPIKHYDDPLRAVCAARALVDAVSNRMEGQRASCSIGVSTGEFTGVVFALLYLVASLSPFHASNFAIC